MTNLGADSEALERLAALIGGTVVRIGQSERTINSQLATAGWRGVDAERLRLEWRRQGSGALGRMQNLLQECATVLQSQAAEQREASAANGGGVALPLGGGPAGPADHSGLFPIGGPVTLPGGLDRGDALDAIRQAAEVINDLLEELGTLGEILDGVPRRIEYLATQLTEIYRSGRFVVEEVVDGVTRQVEVTIEELIRITRWTGRTVDLDSLDDPVKWLKRFGLAGDILTLPLTGWEQWSEDAESRPDLSSTERGVRAVGVGASHGLVQLAIGGVTTAAANAALASSLFTGPVGAGVAAAITVGGVAVGEVAENQLDSFLDSALEEGAWGDTAARNTADTIDDAGRWIRDGAGEVREQMADYLERTVDDDVETVVDAVRGGQEVADATSRSLLEVADDAGHLIGAVTPW